MSNDKNMFLAFGLIMLLLIGYDYFIMAPQREQQQRLAQEQASQQTTPSQGQSGADSILPTTTPGDGSSPLGQGGGTAVMTRESALANSQRVRIDTPRLTGSIALKGGIIDDLTLRDYRVSLDGDAEQVVLLNPRNTQNAYYVNVGWQPSLGAAVAVPGSDTKWTASAETLTPDQPVELTWDNGQGLTFVRRIEIDSDFMFTITQSVRNTTATPVDMAPYGFINRRGTPETSGFFVLHEGPLGVLGGSLKEEDYGDVRDAGSISVPSTGGWLGITDKYWLTSIVPDQSKQFNGRFLHTSRDGTDRYQVDYIENVVSIPAQGSYQVSTRIFAGAKEVDVIERYENAYEITLFDRAVDWGWLFFLTKPLFYVLDFFYGLVGNFGVSILIVTVLVKLVFFPLANKSYHSMAKMKEAQPKLKALQERYKDDKQRLQQEMMAFYKKEKLNPAGGCLPILVQMPVFFALYKVLFVSIEMRHQPFVGWIQDLSASDPATILTLFGFVPWDVPALLGFINIGILPIIMGASMYIQQKLNPTPPDPVQQKVFMFMPIIFTFIMAPFPAGLVLYWTWNNILSILQQYVIMRRAGVAVGGGKATN